MTVLVWCHPSFPHPPVLFGMGDVIAQVVFGEKEASFDFKRTGRAWFFGTFILGPLAHWHFNFLEWLVVRKVTRHSEKASAYPGGGAFGKRACISKQWVPVRGTRCKGMGPQPETSLDPFVHFGWPPQLEMPIGATPGSGLDPGGGGGNPVENQLKTELSLKGKGRTISLFLHQKSFNVNSMQWPQRASKL